MTNMDNRTVPWRILILLRPQFLAWTTVALLLLLLLPQMQQQEQQQQQPRQWWSLSSFSHAQAQPHSPGGRRRIRGLGTGGYLSGGSGMGHVSGSGTRQNQTTTLDDGNHRDNSDNGPLMNPWIASAIVVGLMLIGVPIVYCIRRHYERQRETKIKPMDNQNQQQQQQQQAQRQREATTAAQNTRSLAAQNNTGAVMYSGSFFGGGLDFPG